MSSKIGVERELAKLLYRALNGGNQQLTGMEHGVAFRELRALLDAPAKDPCAEAIEHLERFKEVARSGDVSGIIEMGAELIGNAYFDNSEAPENVEGANTAVNGCGSACIPKDAVAAQYQGEPEFMKPQYLSVPGLWIKCAEDDIGAQRFYRHPAERLAIAEKRNAELESKLLKLSDFARFVIKCVRRNGEYAPLSMQEPDEIKALLAKSTESEANE